MRFRATMVRACAGKRYGAAAYFRRGAFILVILGVLFDAATILPALAGGYVLKRSVGFDLIPHYDTLPDDVIEPALREIAAWLAHHVDQGCAAGG